MSEFIIAIVAGTAIAACAAVAGVLNSSVKVTAKAFTWLSHQAQQEIKRISQGFNKPLPEFSTTKEARKEFEEKFKQIKTKVSQSPLLKNDIDAVSRILTLQHSTVGMFVKDNQWKELFQKRSTANSFKYVLNSATQNSFMLVFIDSRVNQYSRIKLYWHR